MTKMHRLLVLAVATLYVILGGLRLPITCRGQPPSNSFFMLPSNDDIYRQQKRTRPFDINRPIKIATVEGSPYFVRNSTGGASGFIAEIVDRMSEQIDVQFDWFVARSMGKRRKDGNWTGLIGKLIAHEVDVGAVTISQHHSNDRRLAMTHQPIIESTLSLLVNSRIDMDQGQGRHYYLEDLLNDTSIGLGCVLNSGVEQLLRRSELPVHQAVWKRLAAAVAATRTPSTKHAPSSSSSQPSADVVFSSLQNGVRHAADNEHFVLLVESAEAATAKRGPPGCHLTVHDQYFPVAQYYFAVADGESRSANGNPSESFDRRSLLSHLDNSLTRLHDTGVVRQIFDKWMSASDKSDSGCVVESTVTGNRSSSSTGGLNRNPLPADSQSREHVVEDDWRARERIFFESPLRQPVQTTVATAAELSHRTTVVTDVIDHVTTPPADVSESDGDTTPTLAGAHFNHSELRHVTYVETATGTSGYAVTRKHAGKKSKRRRTTMMTPRVQRRRHRHRTTTTVSEPLSTTESSNSPLERKRYDVTKHVYDVFPSLDDRMVPGSFDDVIPDEVGAAEYRSEGATEQEIAVKDHWKRRQVTVNETVDTSTSMADAIDWEQAGNFSENNNMATGSGTRSRFDKFYRFLVIAVACAALLELT